MRNDALDGTHKNFPITDLARLGRFDNRVHCGSGLSISQHNLNFTLGRKSTVYSLPR